jgi:transposase
MARPRRYPEELIERAVRMALESNRPIAHVAADFGMDGERLRRYVHQFQAAGGPLPEPSSTAERAEILRLRKENEDLRRANDILKAASVFFASQLDADRPK